MNLVILDGTTGDPTAGRHLVNLAERLGARVTRFALANLRLAPCLGDFECWTKTPGQCRTQDEVQDILRAMHHADLAIFLTPVVFGGYSAELKKAVDRLIGLAHPNFHERDGLTRHLPRYDRYAPLFIIGLAERTDDEAADIFREIAAGNAVNLMAPTFRSLVLSLAEPGWQGEMEAALRDALAEDPGEPIPPNPDAEALARACAADTGEAAAPPRSVAVLIGSARPKGTSTSESLARQLVGDLDKAGVSTTLIYATQFIKPGRAAEQGLAAMLAADALVVAAPLYVDGLPSLVSRALEQLAARLGQEPHALRRVVGILNNGYPEAVHNHLALRILRCFAHRNGLAWAGGLALGGGEAIHGRPLSSVRLILRAPIKALKMAAAALAAGQPIPAQASRLMARPLAPARLYRWVARLRWFVQARPNGIGQRQLGARPYDPA
ncbi:MAG TPA: NAD(P)H-dependent oxidoreductase [Rhodocyclaceae bacterium]|nr:NAD(P)H-dependent oxidoreductase [Rhodocyclaceae bacterium]